jgi:hypothetical protein
MSTVDAGVTTEGYPQHHELTQAIFALAERHPEACRVSSAGRSRQGRELWVLELARGENREQRSALALVAGIDGDHPAGIAVALRVATALLEAAADTPAAEVLSEHVVYIIPAANPDAMSAFFTRPQAEQRTALRPVDDDRDGKTDEDGPDDLNGDGLITQMRVPVERCRPDELEATQIPDPFEPRLLKPADRATGEVPQFALLVEGRDDDGDGAYNEDGPGGVDLNRNFTHEYPEYGAGAGPHQISEPESKALIDFFLQHPRVAAAIFFGRHDNLAGTKSAPGKDSPERDARAEASAAPPDAAARGGLPGARPPGAGRPPRPQAPRGLHADDVGLYKALAEKYTTLTGLENLPQENADGAVFAWAYAELGIPALACRVWSRPALDDEKRERREGERPPGDRSDGATPDATPPGSDKEAAPSPPKAEEALEADPAKPAQPDAKPGALPDAAALPDEPEGRPQPRPEQAPEGGVPPESGAAGGKEPRPAGRDDEKKKGPADADAAAWLKYSDQQRAGSGFLPWTSCEHPQLGAVEVGGFVPFFRTTPPVEELAAVADKQLVFLVDIARGLPRPALGKPQVTRLAQGVYEIRVLLTNDGYFPTALAIGQQNQRVRPIVIRLDVPAERILGENLVNRVWSIPGSGGRQELRWLVRGEEAGTVTIRMTSEKYGDRDVTVELTGAERSD